MKLARIAVVSTTALALVVGSFGLAGAESKGEEEALPAVVITGGTISNTTTLDLSANAGTSISDASGGSNNVATTSAGCNCDLSSASAGNGGSAISAANGGAISVGDVNSGGNAGNAIVVGNTNGMMEPEKPAGKPDGGKPVDGGKDIVTVDSGPMMGGGGGGGRNRSVVALPSTGVGGVDAGMIASIVAAGAAAAAGLGLRRR